MLTSVCIHTLAIDVDRYNEVLQRFDTVSVESCRQLVAEQVALHVRSNGFVATNDINMNFYWCCVFLNMETIPVLFNVS